MSEPAKKSIFDGINTLYAEQLQGKRVTLTIATVTPVEIVGERGVKESGQCIAFAETKKTFSTSGRAVLRQLRMACGTENPDLMPGKKIVLYPVPSKKSVSGQAIRIAIPEHAA